ncbi:MAG: AAA family ATPase [Flavobacteriales bacterium]
MIYDPVESAITRVDGKLTGEVKSVMVISYSAHHLNGQTVQGKICAEPSGSDSNYIIHYRPDGIRSSKWEYGSTTKSTITFNEKGLQTVKETSHSLGTKSKSQYTYDEDDQVILSESFDSEGLLISKVATTYIAKGKPLERIHYAGRSGNILNKSVHVYDDKLNLLSETEYDSNNKVTRLVTHAYNAQGQPTEYKTEYTDPVKKKYGTWVRYAYNEHGDQSEQVHLKYDGSVINTFTFTNEYDSEGKAIKEIPKPLKPDWYLQEGETEEFEYDAKENWIKRTFFFKGAPAKIIIRKLSYYNDPSENELLEHPMSNYEEGSDDAEAVDLRGFEIEEKDIRWMAEDPSIKTERFPVLRFYVWWVKEIPSTHFYYDPHIEVRTLLKELKKQLGGMVIHQHTKSHSGERPYTESYVVQFTAYYGYLLVVNNIHQDDDEMFDVSRFLHTEYGEYLHFGQVVLYRPPDCSEHRDTFIEEQIDNLIDECSVEKKPDKPRIQMIEVQGGNYVIREHAVHDHFHIQDLDVNYGHGFQQFHTDLMSRFNSSTKGLVLFHGEPGTGKTYYIRHLLRSMVANNKKVIYMPPNMVDHLTDPVFMTFLGNTVRRWSEEGNFCVLLIEDAEPLLAQRQEGVRIQGVTNLLNMTDGLLNDMLNLQIICTFNVDVKKLDSALLRPGRLVARKEFKALSELDANLLAQRLGIKHHFDAPATLGEIYAMRKNSETLVHDIGNATEGSTRVDDL